jgi:DNA-binding NarL/FixJ family response regulator
MHEPLTEREIEILRLAANGCANGEIAFKTASALSISLPSPKPAW